jgi:midasin
MQCYIHYRTIPHNSLVHADTCESLLYGRAGAPWEFNLRDVYRWCDIMMYEQSQVNNTKQQQQQYQQYHWHPEHYLDTIYLLRFRSESDRAAVLDKYNQVFLTTSSTAATTLNTDSTTVSVPQQDTVGACPDIRFTPKQVQIGQVVLQRGIWRLQDIQLLQQEQQQQVTSVLQTSDDTATAVLPHLPIALRRPLQAVARCIAMKWPCLLIGHRATGKSTVINWLASAVGAELKTIALTPATDVTELLGCFEQVYITCI